MASLKYILLCPFLFLCLSYTFANGVFNSNDGSIPGPRAWPIPDPSAGPGVDRGVSNVKAGPRPGPRAGLGIEGWVNNIGAGPRSEPKARPGVEGEVSNVGAGPRAGPKSGSGPKLGVSGMGAGPRAGRKGVDPIVDGVGVRVGHNSESYPPGFGPRPVTGYWPKPRIERYDDCMLGYVCPANECSKFEYEPCESYHFHPMMASTDLHEVDINWAKSKPVATAQHAGSGPVIHNDSAH